MVVPPPPVEERQSGHVWSDARHFIPRLPKLSQSILVTNLVAREALTGRIDAECNFGKLGDGKPKRVDVTMLDTRGR